MSNYILSTAGCVESSSQSSNVLQYLTMPKKLQLHKKNERGETLLHKACKRKDGAQVRVLIQAGISVNMKDYSGWTALHEAAAVGDEEVVEELLKAGADVNARSCDGVTPLHDAVFAGHYQVVKVLLQYGSNASDRNVGGLSALDIAKEDNIKELLTTSQKYRQPGASSSEPHCRSSFSRSCSDTQSRKSHDGNGDKELQDNTTDNLNHSEAVTVVLEKVRRKQREMSTQHMTPLKDTGRYHAALTQIQSVLTEVLTKQRLEKNHLDQKCRSMRHSFFQCVLKSQLSSLISRQRSLMEILQKQMLLVDEYVTVAKLPPSHQGSIAVSPQPNDCSAPTSTTTSSTETHCCDQDSQQKESRRPVARSRLVRAAPANRTKKLTQGKKAPTRTDVQNEEASSCQSTPQPRNTLQPIKFKMTGKKALIQRRDKDNSRDLFKLVQAGAMPSGGALQVYLKGLLHHAHVLADGSIISKGKLHQTPECWLESILGSNIPVSPMYAWDKVTFRDRPLVYYSLTMDAEGNSPQKHLVDGVQRCRAGSSQNVLTTEGDEVSLNHQMKIKIIRLVNDEEFLPNAIMDCYWDELLKSPEDWTVVV